MCHSLPGVHKPIRTRTAVWKYLFRGTDRNVLLSVFLTQKGWHYLKAVTSRKNNSARGKSTGSFSIKTFKSIFEDSTLSTRTLNPKQKMNMKL